MLTPCFRYLVFILLVFSAACSKQEDKSATDGSKKENFLKNQTRALEKAKEVEQMLQIEADKKRRAIEDQSQ